MTLTEHLPGIDNFRGAETTVTVLMPLKNFHARFLEKAIASVLDQTCDDWKLLIIVEPEDNEKFSAMLKEQLLDRRILLINNEGRKLAGALNTGMRHASTAFVAILLSDDMWAPNAVAVLRDYIRQYSDADFFHSSRVIIDENDEPISPVYQSKHEFELEDFVFSPPVKHLLCWRRVFALEHGGMDESINSVGPDDFDFPWSMAEWGAAFLAVDECLYLYRDHFQCYRLTTHLPLSVHVQEIGKIMRKHGVSEELIEAAVNAGKKGHLQQCIYETELDEAISEELGITPAPKWRYEYK